MSNRVTLIGEVSNYYVSEKYGNAWIRVLSSEDDFTSVPILWNVNHVGRTIDLFGDGQIVEVEGELRWVKTKLYETMVVKVHRLRLVHTG